MAPNFWDDPKQAEQIIKTINKKKFWVETFDKLSDDVDELLLVQELYNEKEASEDELQDAYNTAYKTLEDLEFKNMLSAEEDNLNAILEINSGAGGTESQDWSSMLYRMYLMWAEKNGFKVREVDYQKGDEAGIKTATIEIEGDFAYGYLKGENGVHRLVRISPFDANAKRHTSFASVFVFPVVDDSIEIEIKLAKCKIEFISLTF